MLKEGDIMSGRIKILASFVLLGFIAGVAGNFIYYTAGPWLLTFFPAILRIEWVLSGIAGAVLTLIMLVLWAYLSR